MKKKTIVYILIFITFLTISFGYRVKTNNATLDLNDTLRKVLELNINSSPLTGGMTIYTFDIYHDTLYVINKHNLIQISLETGEISKNLEVSNFLNDKLGSNVGVSKIIVRGNGYYLSCLNELYFVNNSGKRNRIYDNGSLINDFNVLENKIILASRDNHIKLISEKGILIKTLPFELVDAEYILANDGLCYSSASQDYIYEFKVSNDDRIIVERYAPIFLTKEIKDPDIAFDSDKYFVGFSYNQRSNLYIINKNAKKNQILKTIYLGQSYVQNMGETDEGKPNFRVAVRKGINYLIIVYDKKLKVNIFNF
jgi:hypothetical protein